MRHLNAEYICIFQTNSDSDLPPPAVKCEKAESSLTTNSPVCEQCFYKVYSYVQTIKQSHKCLSPSDSLDLQNIILVQQTKLLNFHPLFVEDICLAKTVLYVGNKLLAEEPLLLKDVKAYYCECYIAHTVSPSLHVSSSTNVSTTWIKLELNRIFKDHWSLSTLTKDGKQKKAYSTLILRKGTNLKNVVHTCTIKCSQYSDTEAEYESRIDHLKQEIQRLKNLKSNSGLIFASISCN